MGVAREWFDGMWPEVGSTLTIRRDGDVVLANIPCLAQRVEWEVSASAGQRFAGGARRVTLMRADIGGYEAEAGDVYELAGKRYQLSKGEAMTEGSWDGEVVVLVIRALREAPP